jgi:hypothetical protein
MHGAAALAGAGLSAGAVGELHGAAGSWSGQEAAGPSCAPVAAVDLLLGLVAGPAVELVSGQADPAVVVASWAVAEGPAAVVSSAVVAGPAVVAVVSPAAVAGAAVAAAWEAVVAVGAAVVAAAVADDRPTTRA